MTQANDSITVTPGTGAAVATHLVNSKEHPVELLADADGHILGSLPVYRLQVPPQAVGANKVMADLFNASGSGVKMRVLRAIAYPNLDAAVTGTLGVRISLTRTSTVGTGGTATSAEGTDPTVGTISKLDTTFASLPGQVTARVAPAGGATAGAVISTRQMFTEETNAGTAAGAALGVELISGLGDELIVREGEGIRLLQGAVASVGSIGFDVLFELVA